MNFPPGWALDMRRVKPTLWVMPDGSYLRYVDGLWNAFRGKRLIGRAPSLLAARAKLLTGI